MEEAVAAYTARAAEKMRRQNLTTASLQVFVQTNRFELRTRSILRRKRAAAGSDGRHRQTDERRAARDRRHLEAGLPLQEGRRDISGSAAGDRSAGDAVRSARHSGEEAADATVDSFNARYGRDTVTYAASGRRRAWKLRSDQLSPRYTTDWDELLSVR